MILLPTISIKRSTLCYPKFGISAIRSENLTAGDSRALPKPPESQRVTVSVRCECAVALAVLDELMRRSMAATYDGAKPPAPLGPIEVGGPVSYYLCG